jgi:hypothetical protein
VKVPHIIKRSCSMMAPSHERAVIASTFLGSEGFIERIRKEYLEDKIFDKRNQPAVKQIQKGPSPGEIEKAVTKVVGKDHVHYKKRCIAMFFAPTAVLMRRVCFGWRLVLPRRG